jgi:quercetin dioxygenase-like cupin family protein
MNARFRLSSLPATSEVGLFNRNDIQPMLGATINGVWRAAGAVYPVRVPESSAQAGLWSRVLLPGWSISWTSLPNHEVLDSHYHPVVSYVAIVKGRAQLIGQQTGYFDAGSVIRIPAWHLHGFKTISGQDPFWAITWQPLAHSLFTETEPNVFYPGDEGAPAEPDPRICAEISQARIRPFVDQDAAGAPQFEFIDLSTEKKRRFEVAGRAVLCCVSGRACVKTDSSEIEMKEGDMVPFFANSESDSVVCQQVEAGTAFALLRL